MCDKKPWKLAMNTHGNIDDIDSSRPKLRRRCCMCDEKLWQLAMKVRRYCHGGQSEKKNPMNYRQYCDDGIKFKKKNYTRYGITILHCNMVYHITM